MPLHVANVTLGSSADLLCVACLHSHSHPLRCKALELCFNVALNRLPSVAASCASALLVPPPAYHPHRLPSLSNALVAAFKQAQAPNSESTINSKPIKTKPSVQAKIDDDDEAAIIKALASKEWRGTLVIVGESLNAMDTTIRGVMERVENGQVLAVLTDVAFITLTLFSFKHMLREEVAEKIDELREVLIRISCWEGRGVVVYLGDLKWIAEEIKGRRPGLIGPLEHVVMEIMSLLFDEIAGQVPSRSLSPKSKTGA
ncbi:protein SMAX1-LIKE 3-like isoform X1 [Canna indica]|uniref:Protein SMAX1-LIKE 3-like isoform X1 n=1 Tax=Canna indica TaxID=4628 RepID=A0AAQ3JWQ9_9LILI|nr:protein SMAX1-LIKE 3-like isoform X1 [Canna indica]